MDYHTSGLIDSTKVSDCVYIVERGVNVLEYEPKGRAISYRLNGGHIPISRILVDCIPPPRLD